MSTLTSEQALFILNATGLPSLKMEHGITKSVIAAIPREKSGYRPDDIGRSALDLGWHIAASEVRFFTAVATGAFDFAGAARPETIQTPAQVVDWYVEHHAKAVAALEQATGEQLATVVDFRGVFQLPAVMYVPLALSHTTHHRGQLSMYLRPMGAKVPSMYGESYDAREAREKAQAAKA